MLVALDVQQIFSVGLILFGATVVVRLAGFGGALVAMPLLVPMLTLPVSSAVMNLFGITNFGVVLLRNRQTVTFRDVWRMALTAVLFVPLGIYLIFVVPEWLMRLVLGTICMSYGIYSSLTVKELVVTNLNWQWLVGSLSGLFAGAFNVGGVVAVLYTDTQQWEPERFRLNMFSFFLTTAVFGLISRYVSNLLTAQVLIIWLGSVPFLLLGLAVGGYLSPFISRPRFRQLVRGMLVLLGARLIWSALA